MPEGAVYVGRPSLWGNPWTVRDASSLYRVPEPERAAWAVARYRRELEHWALFSDWGFYVSEERWRQVRDEFRDRGFQNMRDAAVVLAGLDLACWCPLDQPCHADVLLELANGGGRG